VGATADAVERASTQTKALGSRSRSLRRELASAEDDA
jgi:hypothetical protein